MSLNNIKLNPVFMTEMYKDVLVEDPDLGRSQNDSDQEKEQSVEKQVAQEENWKWLGDYKKKILVVVYDPGLSYIADDRLNFLTTILSACNLSLGDVAILNLATTGQAVFSEVQRKFKSNVTILFGISPEQFGMPINFPEFQIQPFNNCTFLFTPAIELMEKDKLLKSKLWVSLKKIFGLQ